MKKLTQNDLQGLTTNELKTLMDELQDLSCNIDYIANPTDADIVNSNLHLVEAKLVFNEF